MSQAIIYSIGNTKSGFMYDAMVVTDETAFDFMENATCVQDLKNEAIKRFISPAKGAQEILYLDKVDAFVYFNEATKAAINEIAVDDFKFSTPNIDLAQVKINAMNLEQQQEMQRKFNPPYSCISKYNSFIPAFPDGVQVGYKELVNDDPSAKFGEIVGLITKELMNTSAKDYILKWFSGNTNRNVNENYYNVSLFLNNFNTAYKFLDKLMMVVREKGVFDMALSALFVQGFAIIFESDENQEIFYRDRYLEAFHEALNVDVHYLTIEK